MKQALVIGSGSDIAKELIARLDRDGWSVTGVAGRSWSLPMTSWDLLILAHGQLTPIGKFFETARYDWWKAVSLNGLAPLETMRTLWPQRKEGATVVFISGPNMANPSATYSAYRAGKAILEALLPTLNEEYPGTKFKMLRPGVVNTKIHKQTVEAGEKAANLERVLRIVHGEEKTVTHDEVYERLKVLL